VLSVGDTLLYALSAWRSVSWPSYKRSFDELSCGLDAGEAPELGHRLGSSRQHAALLLDSLGHCDVTLVRGRGNIYVAPASLCMVPSPGMPTALCIGSRSRNLLRQLEQSPQSREGLIFPQAGSQAHLDPFAPARVQVSSPCIDHLQSLATELGFSFSIQSPAWRLANVCPSLDDYVSCLEWHRTRELDWLCADFDPVSLRFRSAQAARAPIRLSSYRDPVTGLPTFLLWRGDTYAVVDPRWGRYALLSMLEMNVLSYSRTSGRVAIPAGAPLPRILSRALSLCSGWAPVLTQIDLPGCRSGLPAYEFACVPEHVLLRVAQAVLQQPHAIPDQVR